LVNRNISSVPRIVGDMAKALPGQMTRPVPVILEAVMKLDEWLHPVSFPLKQFTFQHSFWVVKLGVLFCCCLLICFSLTFLSPAKGAGMFYKEFSASSRDYLGAEGGIEPVPLLFDVPHSPPPLITARAPPDSELKGSIEVLEENVPSKAAPDDWEWLHQVYNNGKIPFEVKEHHCPGEVGCRALLLPHNIPCHVIHCLPEPLWDLPTRVVPVIYPRALDSAAYELPPSRVIPASMSGRAFVAEQLQAAAAATASSNVVEGPHAPSPILPSSPPAESEAVVSQMGLSTPSPKETRGRPAKLKWDNIADAEPGSSR
jgi:hypothetical protein